MNVASYDDDKLTLVRLFHPRRDEWQEHFELLEGVIVPHTSIAQVTVRVLKLNDPKQVRARRLLIETGIWDMPLDE